MDLNNISVNEFVSNFDFNPDNLEYVEDIGTEEDYGIAVRGKISYQDRRISVLGAVVLEPTTGEPKVSDHKTCFTAYVNGITEGDEAEKILEESRAVRAMENLYKEARKDGDMFSRRSEVDIDPIARSTKNN